MKFLRVSRNIILALKFLTIAGLLISSIMILFYPETIHNYNWAGFSLVPENEDLLKDYEGIDLQFKPDPSIESYLVIEKTQVRMDGILPNMRMGIWVFLVGLCLTWYFILMQVDRMIKSVEDGNPFNQGNVKGIYFLAMLLACFPMLERFFRVWQKHWIKTSFDMEGIVFVNESSDLIPWLIPVILLVTIGKMLEMGRELKQEQDLTI
ncbi:MAG: DUF2975 domain-containing protein [Saprospiraceae bacterium]|nr:DUF2975 domain-containing protein [Saprospiraceae bacterium]